MLKIDEGRGSPATYHSVLAPADEPGLPGCAKTRPCVGVGGEAEGHEVCASLERACGLALAMEVMDRQACVSLVFLYPSILVSGTRDGTSVA